MLNLAVLNVGSPRMSIHETALQLLHLLDARFLQEEVVFTAAADDLPRPPQLPLNDVLLAVSYYHSQMCLSQQLARLHPDLTMPMFSGRICEHGCVFVSACITVFCVCVCACIRMIDKNLDVCGYVYIFIY